MTSSVHFYKGAVAGGYTHSQEKNSKEWHDVADGLHKILKTSLELDAPWLSAPSMSSDGVALCSVLRERSRIVLSTYVMSNTVLGTVISLFHLHIFFIETTVLLKYWLSSPFYRWGNFPGKVKEITWSRSLLERGKAGLESAPMTSTSTLPSKGCCPLVQVSSLP